MFQFYNKSYSFTVKRGQRKYLMAAHNEINKDAENTINMNAKPPKSAPEQPK